MAIIQILVYFPTSILKSNSHSQRMCWNKTGGQLGFVDMCSLLALADTGLQFTSCAGFLRMPTDV